jgi:radical SAM superfamily enzyme YgiQ (UPF0313 family)
MIKRKEDLFDVIFVLGEKYLDHPLCGVAILRRLLEKKGFSVAVIETPSNAKDITKFGKPKLFFGVSSGSIDSMLRNYTSLNRPRENDNLLAYEKKIPDRADIVYCNWIKQEFKESIIVLGGIEATMRRFTHYDFWSNSLRKSIILDSRANILVYGAGEKQVLEIAHRIKNNKGNPRETNLTDIEGTCLKLREAPVEFIGKKFIVLPSHEEVLNSKERFCDMQNMLSNANNICQKTDNFYIVQYKSPEYKTEDLDEYYELPFSRKIKDLSMKRFRFGIVTHRGCIGNCNFCSLRLTMGDKIISRSEESILREIEYITKLKDFNGIIDDFGGPSANMWAIDFERDLEKSHNRLVELLRKAREIKGVKKIFIRSGVRYDLCTKEYIKEVVLHHTSGKLKIAPEHISKNVLELMNKSGSNLEGFIKEFNKVGGAYLTFYFMVGHPGNSMKEAKELAKQIKKFKHSESVQIFTPTPMTVSTCMYYTGLDPLTKKKIYVPYSFKEKKEQKKILGLPNSNKDNIEY